MKKICFTKMMLTICAGILVSAAVSSFIPSHGEERLYSDVVRLHVIAESDSSEDQALKLSVRDSVLEAVSDCLYGVEDFDSAVEKLSEVLPEIKKIAEERCVTEGRRKECAVELDREEYPVRYYDDFALPGGEYMSLRVTIGEGEGQNWWCVLFPRMCSAAAVESSPEDEFYAAGFTPEEYRIIKKDTSPRYKVRFRILELLADTFGFDY